MTTCELPGAYAEDAIINRSPLYAPVYGTCDRAAQPTLGHDHHYNVRRLTIGLGAPRSLRLEKQQNNAWSSFRGYKRRPRHTGKYTWFPMLISTRRNILTVTLAFIFYSTNCTVKDYRRSRHDEDCCCACWYPAENEIIMRVVCDRKKNCDVLFRKGFLLLTAVQAAGSRTRLTTWHAICMEDPAIWPPGCFLPQGPQL